MGADRVIATLMATRVGDTRGTSDSSSDGAEDVEIGNDGCEYEREERAGRPHRMGREQKRGASSKGTSPPTISHGGWFCTPNMHTINPRTIVNQYEEKKEIGKHRWFSARICKKCS